MSSIAEIRYKIRRRWYKMLYRPIHVFVFHHVSDVRDPLVCQEPDWTQLDQFKCNIEHLMQQYTFISLTEAYDKLQHDRFRFHKYAVLTTDDGLASVLNVIPWLEKKKIPLTLFINTRYMDGDKIKPVHQKWLHELAPDADEKDIAKRMYLSKEQVWALKSPFIEIGMHGHEHLNIYHIDESQFEKDIAMCRNILHIHPRYVSMYAYPWGKATKDSISYLLNLNIVPVVLRGESNYAWNGIIDRECIDNMEF